MKRSVLILTLVLLLGNTMLLATHIVGGEFEMLHIEGDRYLFRQIQYFDVVNGDPNAKDQVIQASIFRKRDNVFVSSVFMTYRSESLVPYSNPVCTYDRLITNKIEYSTEVTLDPNLFSDPQGYYMVWERCCRNNIINNIVAPEETGQTFYLEFPAIRRNGAEFRNSSPQLFPPLSDYACVNRFYYVDFRGFDPDGDSLVYSLATPLNSSEFKPLPTPTPSPHPFVSWVSGFSSSYQVPGDPTLDINKKGFLTVTPSEEGLFVFSVKCEEYRNGEKIGEVVRDFQLFVIDCPSPGNPPEIQVKAPKSEVFLSALDTIVLTTEDSKCFDFRIRDKDGSETINIRAEPVNFEANLQNILSVSTGYLDQPGDTLGVQVCLPDCPYLQDEPLVIDVIARDFTCPQPLMDTLRLIVLVEPPPNRPPKFIYPDGDITATFIEGSNISFTFQAMDEDLDSLLLSVEGDGFELSDFGIKIDTMNFEAGLIDFNLNWDTDCRIYPFGLKNEFQIKLYVEDADLCGVENRDSVTLHITIDLPENNAPVVLIDNEHVNKELTVRVEEDVSFDIRAFDGDPTDILVLEAIGVGFDLADLGIDFQRQEGYSTLKTDLTWEVTCEHFDQLAANSYEVLLITEDLDKCKIPNADTLSITFNVLPPNNNPPRILVNGGVLNDTLFVNAGALLDLDISGYDSDGDQIAIAMADYLAAEEMGVEFASKSGNGSVSTRFGWQTDCSHLGEEYQERAYNFRIVLMDSKCIVPASDTLDMVVVIRDEQIEYDILPPNVFTPNDDDIINESYYVPGLPENNCRRQFEGIVIYNRWGKEVFSSDQREFRWYGRDEPNGVYYYLISYTDFSIKGTISILR